MNDLELFQLDPRIEADVQESDLVAVHHNAGLFVWLVAHIADHNIVGSGCDRFDEICAIEIRCTTGDLRPAVLNDNVYEGQWLSTLLIRDRTL